MDRQTLYLNACHDTLSKLGALSYDFNPDRPRDDHGQWVAAGELESAKHDSAAAAALRSRVTRPKEKAKLEATLGAEAKPFTPRSIPQTSDTPGAAPAGAGGGAPGLQSHPDWDTILATLGGAGARQTPRRAMVDTSGGGELGHIPLDLRDEFNAPARNARYAQPSASISPEKARQILHDGTVQGHPLTDAQRGMFGAAAGRTDNDARFRYAADPAPNQYNCPGFPHDSFGRPRGVMQTVGHGAFRGGRFGADSGDTPYDGDVRRGSSSTMDPSDLFLALSLLGHQARDLRRRD